MSGLIDFSEDRALVLKNGDWLLPLNYIDFLREVGVHFSVNRMLTAECFKSRMEKGLTFLEFNYMLMQSYDFYVLYSKYGCVLEMGGGRPVVEYPGAASSSFAASCARRRTASPLPC